jgi:hypothetical protein
MKIFYFLLLPHLLLSYDFIYFYRATPIIPEPRFERDKLFSFDFFFHTGESKHGLNKEGHKVPLLDIYGLINPTKLSSGVPFLLPNNQLDFILINLEKIPPHDNARLSLSGKLLTHEYNFFFTYNVLSYIFFQIHLPIRTVEILSPHIVDLSSASVKNSPEWRLFLQNFDAILDRHNLSLKPFLKTVFGNISILGGFSHSYIEHYFLDFIDISLVSGLTIPTEQKQTLKNIVAIPFFHQGQLGIPLQGRFSLGAYDWLTIGFYGEITFFFDRTLKEKVTSSLEQNGILHLATAQVDKHKGPRFQVASYIKADHVIRGFSFFLGYSFAGAYSDILHAKNIKLFSYEDINHNAQIKGWNMHTIHYTFEYDFSLKNTHIGPRISLGGVMVIGGNRIIKTNLMMLQIGLDILF